MSNEEAAGPSGQSLEVIVTKEEGMIWHNTIAAAPKPGYLAVMLVTQIEKRPVEGASVRFYKSDASGTQGTEVTPEAIKSDEDGFAVLDKIVDAGCYLCVVQDEMSEVIMPVPTKIGAEEILLPRGYLSIRVHNFGKLVAGLTARFYETDEHGNISTDKLVGMAETYWDGTASLRNEVKIRNYACSIEGQDEVAMVSTVEDKRRPYEIAIPIGRSQIDFAEADDLLSIKPLADGPPPFAGYLSVKVLYDGEPYEGVDLAFYSIGDGGKKDVLLARARTNEQGLADSGEMFLPGNYLCEVDQEGEFSVSTVESSGKPYIIELPVGRSRVSEVVEPAGQPIQKIPDASAPLVGHLSVKVLQRSEPVVGLPVNFFLVGTDGTPAGAPMEATTGPDGLATLPDMFAVGNYIVEIDGATATISTVERADAPYPLEIPLGRGRVAEEPEPPAQPLGAVPEMSSSPGGYLSVRILFRGEPYPGLPVGFFTLGKDGKRGPLVSQAETNEDGVATAEGMFVVGNYLCEIEGKEVSLTTVEAVNKPYTISLPIGKSVVSEPEAAPEPPPPAGMPNQAAPELEYLSVKVRSKAGLTSGARVRFYANLKGDKRGPLVGEARTDFLGVASLDDSFLYGRYWCVVEDGPGMLVETTIRTDLPVTLEGPST